MLPTVSIIVPAKNEEKVIGNCIKSLLNLNYPKNKLEIVAVIDKSTDKTLEICKRFKPRIKIFQPKKPSKCKAEAINSVLPRLKGEIVGIYDADCIVEKNCIINAVKHFSDKKMVGVTGMVKSYNKNENAITRALSIETCFIMFMEYLFNRLGAKAPLLGKNIFIRKNFLKKIGGFDEEVFSEDIAISFKIKRMPNCNCVIEPKAIAWHEEPNSFKSFWRQRTRWARGSIRTLKKYSLRFSFKDFLSDMVHGIYFYVAPFGLLLGIFLTILLLLHLPLVFFIPLLALFLFIIGLLVYSRIYFKEPLRDLIYFPVWYFLGNVHLILLLKALIDERSGKSFEWFRVTRSDYKVQFYE